MSAMDSIPIRGGDKKRRGQKIREERIVEASREGSWPLGIHPWRRTAAGRSRRRQREGARPSPQSRWPAWEDGVRTLSIKSFVRGIVRNWNCGEQCYLTKTSRENWGGEITSNRFSRTLIDIFIFQADDRRGESKFSQFCYHCNISGSMGN